MAGGHWDHHKLFEAAGKEGQGSSIVWGTHHFLTTLGGWVGEGPMYPCSIVPMYLLHPCAIVPCKITYTSQPASGLTRFSAGLKVSFTKFLLEHFIHLGSLSLKSPFASRSLSKFYKKGFEWRLRCIILALTWMKEELVHDQRLKLPALKTFCKMAKTAVITSIADNEG